MLSFSQRDPSLRAPPPDPAANLSPAHQAHRPNVSRPSLKITRHDNREPPWDVSFEVSRLA